MSPSISTQPASLKASFFMDSTLSGIVSSFRDLHPAKAYASISFRFSESFMSVITLQPKKAYGPISITESGNSTSKMSLQHTNAKSPIFSVLSETFTSVFMIPGGQATKVLMSLVYKIPSSEAKYSLSSGAFISHMYITAIALQLKTAIFFERLSFSRFVQFLKAESPIATTGMYFVLVVTIY